ncbi:hypothetical protein [Pedobacter zeae]|uniref:Uncharacterized protein n=2 Tax=Pedobacter zeae TaxID=1737356 RepID=A0A7W6K6I7_9SPHI|nr:hypothetical protein [Pedobacter zeae]MBB4106138.1 hypothetical protein [Pedobacter zeae]
MIRSQNLLCIFSCLLLFIVSCKKEGDKEEVLKYPISLTYKSYSKGKMRMWTMNGEVLDQQKIANFAGNAFANSFDANFYQIKFTKPDSAEIRYPPALDGFWTYKVKDSANIDFKGDVHLFHGMVFGNQATLDRSFLIYRTSIYTQPVRVINQPTSIPPIIYRADLGFKATGNKKALMISGYLYKLRLYNRAAIFSGHMFGDFNERFLNELQDRDTLVVQLTKNNWAL